MPPRRRLVAALAAAAAAVVALPLLGVWSTGAPVAGYLAFPPTTRPVAPAPFAWPAFAAVAGATAGGLLFFALRAAGSWRRSLPPPAAAPAGRFPLWGWGALVGLAAAWALAWTRLPSAAALQPHTFTPLWLAYILVVNALCLRRTGGAPMTRRPRLFLALFPASALFWWVFEYLNRFVRNWYYEGPELGAWAYVGWASLAFSTVLPAVASTAEWLAASPRLRRAFGAVAPLAGAWFGRPAGIAAAAAAAVGLAAVGRRPDLFFPLLWVAPLLLLAAALGAAGLGQPLRRLETSDWTVPVSWALAALVCGFFWELWNYYSLARWRYAIPYLQRFTLFEMPLLGYAGYLPFGLECALAVQAVEALLASPRGVADGRKRLSIRSTPQA